MIEEIPDIPPFSINTLDASGDWVDSSSNYNTNTIEESTNAAGQTFAEMYPESNLKFYKRFPLKIDRASNRNIRKSLVNFKFYK